jgi:hypothetical protein
MPGAPRWRLPALASPRRDQAYGRERGLYQQGSAVVAST